MSKLNNARSVGLLAAAMLLFGAGLTATIFILHAETSRYETFNRDAASVAGDQLPLLLALTEIQTDIGRIQQLLLEGASAQGAPSELSGRLKAVTTFAEKFWIDVGTARNHAKNLEVVEVLEGVDAIEMLFPLYYDTGVQLVRALSDRGQGIDREMMAGFNLLAASMGGSLNQLPILVERLTQERLFATAQRSAASSRRDTVLLRFVIVITVLGGILAAAGALHLYRHMAAQYRLLAVERDRAERAARTKSQFLSNMSHELRTPLNAIIGFSELIRDGRLGPVGNPKYTEYGGDINVAGTHLLNLINDILDLSKIEAGKVELREKDVVVANIIGACVTLVKQSAQSASVNLKLEIADGLPHLYADELKLKQILINILSNAVKYTPPGGKVTVRAWLQSDDGLMLQIADTGIGIALEDIPKALAPFQQIDSSYSRRQGGTGLGLALAKELVELHGGSLDLQSQPGVGTVVTIRMPAQRVANSPHDRLADLVHAVSN